ncbi:MAG: WD40 repeat domain-containing protein [Verrucomicrobia bacterium]|nr:WD40 repeat domain-containing protein [Verrucomicrobiota bacterium]
MSSVFVPERPLEWSQSLGDFLPTISWSPDGQSLVATGSLGPLFLVYASNGGVRRHWSGHQLGSFAAAFSPTASVVASVGQDGFARLWHPDEDAPRQSIPTTSKWIEQLAWAPDGRRWAIGAGKEIQVISADGTQIQRGTPRSSTVTALAWRADSKVLATTSYGEVYRWNVSSGETEPPLVWKTSMISLAWSPDQRWIAAGTQEQCVQIWELPYRPGDELAMSGYSVKVRELAWHYGSRFLATADGTEVMVWDCQGSGPAGTAPRILTGHAQRINRLAYQRAGHLLASGSEDGQVLLWNAGKGTLPLRRYQVPGAVSSLSWSPDGRYLAIGTKEGTLALAVVDL